MAASEIRSGKFMDFNRVGTPEFIASIEIDDIATSLALQARFNGHGVVETSDSLVGYSVAQHSVFVSNCVLGLHARLLKSDPADPLAGWFEAYGVAKEQACDYGDLDAVALKALMHDAHEYLVGDIPTPLKRSLPGLKAEIDLITDKIDLAIAEKFGIDPMSEFERRLIKLADDLACRMEATALMLSRGDGPHWESMPYDSIFTVDVVWRPHEAKRQFINRFLTITRNIHPQGKI